MENEAVSPSTLHSIPPEDPCGQSDVTFHSTIKCTQCGASPEEYKGAEQEAENIKGIEY